MAGVVDSGLLYHATLEPSFGEPGGNAIHQDKRQFGLRRYYIVQTVFSLRLRVILSLSSFLHLSSAKVTGLHPHNT